MDNKKFLNFFVLDLGIASYQTVEKLDSEYTCSFIYIVNELSFLCYSV